MSNLKASTSEPAYLSPRLIVGNHEAVENAEKVLEDLGFAHVEHSHGLLWHHKATNETALIFPNGVTTIFAHSYGKMPTAKLMVTAKGYVVTGDEID